MDGILTLTFYANDTTGRISSESVIIIKDTTDPTINIISPILNQLFDEIAPDYIVEIYDTSLDSMWYSLDGGTTIYVISQLTGTIDQDLWNSLANGNYTLIFYANDTLAHIGTNEVNIVKFIAPEPGPEPAIPFGFGFIFVTFLSTTLILIFLKNKQKFELT